MESTDKQLATAITSNACKTLNDACDKIRHCLQQLDDEQIWWRPAEEQNSIGNLLLHLTGNLRQWLVSGLGNGDDARNRPAEFSTRSGDSASVAQSLWEAVADTNSALLAQSAANLLEDRRIQGFDVTCLEAIFDSVSHFVGHAQQIVYVTRWQLGDAYRFHWQPSTPEETSGG